MIWISIILYNRSKENGLKVHDFLMLILIFTYLVIGMIIFYNYQAQDIL